MHDFEQLRESALRSSQRRVALRYVRSGYRPNADDARRSRARKVAAAREAHRGLFSRLYLDDGTGGVLP